MRTQRACLRRWDSCASVSEREPLGGPARGGVKMAMGLEESATMGTSSEHQEKVVESGPVECGPVAELTRARAVALDAFARALEPRRGAHPGPHGSQLSAHPGSQLGAQATAQHGSMHGSQLSSQRGGPHGSQLSAQTTAHHDGSHEGKHDGKHGGQSSRGGLGAEWCLQGQDEAVHEPVRSRGAADEVARLELALARCGLRLRRAAW